MKAYLVTWFDEYFSEYRTEKVEAHNIVKACNSFSADMESIVAVIEAPKEEVKAIFLKHCGVEVEE